MTDASTKKVIVIGAGVIGLTTAIVIQEKDGYKVTIVAELLPSDPKSTRYTSHWAGAHHVSLASSTDSKQQGKLLYLDYDSALSGLEIEMDLETFKVMWEMSAPGSLTENCFLRMTQEEYHCEERPEPDVHSFMPDYRVQPPEVWPNGAVHGIAFSTVTIDTPVYLEYLMSRFLNNGGTVIRGNVQHIDQLVEGGEHVIDGGSEGPVSPDAIVVCVGLGARTLSGVDDQDVYPIRGQTVLLRAPWIRFGRTLSSMNGTWTYIIPRKSGDVIVGGTVVPNDWYPRPRPETTRDILERVFTLCPELAPPEIRAVREPAVEDLLPIIIEEGCGFRPGRKGGIRIEGEKKGSVSIVYNYGHGGYGYIASWGSANRALAVLEGLLKK
ncbi:D-amino-acid oxidase [Termitomyces sp. J132]|nr:D-amino-acid oxidase [Termitomyces sp. J132]